MSVDPNGEYGYGYGLFFGTVIGMGVGYFAGLWANDWNFSYRDKGSWIFGGAVIGAAIGFSQSEHVQNMWALKTTAGFHTNDELAKIAKDNTVAHKLNATIPGKEGVISLDQQANSMKWRFDRDIENNSCESSNKEIVVDTRTMREHLSSDPMENARGVIHSYHEVGHSIANNLQYTRIDGEFFAAQIEAGVFLAEFTQLWKGKNDAQEAAFKKDFYWTMYGEESREIIKDYLTNATDFIKSYGLVYPRPFGLTSVIIAPVPIVIKP